MRFGSLTGGTKLSGSPRNYCRVAYPSFWTIRFSTAALEQADHQPLLQQSVVAIRLLILQPF
jgi:hypothetical protein